jgi:hypothetical protein
MRAAFAFVLFSATQCSISDGLAEWLDASDGVPLEKATATKRGAPEVAPPKPRPERDPDACAHDDLMGCAAAVAAAKKASSEEKRRVFRAARQLCLEPSPKAKASWQGRDTFEDELASVCGSIAEDELWSHAEAKEMLARACELTSDGHGCFMAAFALFNSKDRLYDLRAALPLVQRGCALGHGPSCKQVETVENAIREEG